MDDDYCLSDSPKTDWSNEGSGFLLVKGTVEFLYNPQKTPENEINSRLGMHIKRDILMKLADPEFQRSKPDIAAKYADFTISVSILTLVVELLV